MSDLDVADPDGMGRVDTILVSVAPPDGAAIAAALRDRGFAVVEAPLQMLGARAVGESPQVMIVDLDPPGALDAVERARDAVPRAELLCVGDPVRAAELGMSRADGRAFERPVDIDALLLAVLALAEPMVDLWSLGSAPSLTPAHGMSSARETVPPMRRSESEAPPASEYPSTSDPLEVAAILPAFDDPEAFGAIAPIEVGPELAQILEGAEQRVNAAGVSPSSIPSPDEELDLILSAEMLATLDEPLDPDDDASGTGGSVITGGGATGFPKVRTRGERTSGARTATPAPATATGTGPERLTAAETHAGRSASTSARPPATPPSVPAPPGGGRITSPPTALELPPDRPSVAPSRDIEERPRREVSTAATQPPPAPSMPLQPMTAQPMAAAQPFVQPTAAQPVAPQPFVQPMAMQPVAQPMAAQPMAQPPPAPSPSQPRAATSADPAFPAVLGPGDAVRAVALAIASRASGALALGNEAAMRRIVLHDGDVVTAASTSPDETLIAFLAQRGDLDRDLAARLAGRLPAFGRHAGAALIAHGHLGQDDLWPVLRAHAEWIIGRALASDEGTCELEAEPPGRLRAEPNVFGGATGAEVMLEAIRRVIPPDEARRRLGGLGARIAAGPRQQLLAECALAPEEEQLVRSAAGRTVNELLASAAPELSDVLYGLVALGVLEALTPARAPEPAASTVDPLDEEAVRQRVRARVSLVEDGDYFALLGIPRTATGYEIRRAYLELRRAFEPARVLTAATADLASDVRLVIEVLDEAYEILREPHRRERYRKAIEAGPP
ncbi:MAG: hypothetical protein QM820_15420 [Minicystis sp.]